MSDFAKMANDYLSYLQYVKKYSALTVTGYQRDIYEFIDYCHRKGWGCSIFFFKRLSGIFTY